jgi:hypothetical protein
MPRYRAKRDANESPLVALARMIGAEFEMIGPLDWWVGFRGRWVPLEIKNIDGKNEYTDKQVRFLIRCKERQLPVWTWRTEADVYRDLGARRTA